MTTCLNSVRNVPHTIFNNVVSKNCFTQIFDLNVKWIIFTIYICNKITLLAYTNAAIIILFTYTHTLKYP